MWLQLTQTNWYLLPLLIWNFCRFQLNKRTESFALMKKVTNEKPRLYWKSHKSWIVPEIKQICLRLCKNHTQRALFDKITALGLLVMQFWMNHQLYKFQIYLKRTDGNFLMMRVQNLLLKNVEERQKRMKFVVFPVTTKLLVKLKANRLFGLWQSAKSFSLKKSLKMNFNVILKGPHCVYWYFL